MIDIVRETRDAIARHLDQGWANVNAFYLVAETSEVFAQPTRTAAHIQNATAGRQPKRDGDVGKVAKMTMCFRIHPVTLMFGRFVRQIVEGFGLEVMIALRIKPARVINCRLLVINTLRLRHATDRRWMSSGIGRFLAVRRRRLRLSGAGG